MWYPMLCQATHLLLHKTTPPMYTETTEMKTLLIAINTVEFVYQHGKTCSMRTFVTRHGRWKMLDLEKDGPNCSSGKCTDARKWSGRLGPSFSGPAFSRYYYFVVRHFPFCDFSVPWYIDNGKHTFSLLAYAAHQQRFTWCTEQILLNLLTYLQTKSSRIIKAVAHLHPGSLQIQLNKSSVDFHKKF